MLSHTFQYNGVTFNSLSDIQAGIYICVLKVGGLSSPEVIHREDRLIGQHGIIDYYSFIGRRIISLEGAVVGTSEATMLTKLKTFTDAFTLEALPEVGRDGYHDLVMSKTGEVTKKISAKVHSLPRIDKDLKIHRMRRFFVELRCEDPRIVSSALHEDTLLKATTSTQLPAVLPMVLGSTEVYGNEITVVNAGNFGALPTYRINGPCHDPEIINVSYPDITQKFELTLALGEYIDVDVKAGTATKNDGSNVLVYETDDSKWIVLLPGNNVLRLITSATEEDAGANVEIEWRDTWLSVPR